MDIEFPFINLRILLINISNPQLEVQKKNLQRNTEAFSSTK